jgi:hypothetical protein
MAAIIKAGRGAFNEWVTGKMGKYVQNYKAWNFSNLYIIVSYSEGSTFSTLKGVRKK